MQNCCTDVNIQWYPDPNAPGQFNLVCASCGSIWRPWTPQEIAPPVPPMAPFETQVINKLDAIMNEFPIEGAGRVVAPLTGDDGAPGAYQVAWENLASLVPEQESWTSDKLATTMEKVLSESQPLEDQDPEIPF